MPLDQQFTAAVGAMRGQFRGKYSEVQTVSDTLMEAVERALANFPKLERAYLGRCGLDNEELMRTVYDSMADGMTVNFPDKLVEYIKLQTGGLTRDF